MAEGKGSKFGLGLALGALAGAAAAFFLSPKSGPENREMVAKKVKALKKKLDEAEIPEKLDKMSDDAKKFYKKVSKELSKDLDALKDRVDEVDWDKYREMVDEVIARVKVEIKIAEDEADQMKAYLLDQWDTVLNEAKKDTKKIAKSASKPVKKTTKKAKK